MVHKKPRQQQPPHKNHPESLLLSSTQETSSFDSPRWVAHDQSKNDDYKHRHRRRKTSIRCPLSCQALRHPLEISPIFHQWNFQILILYPALGIRQTITANQPTRGGGFAPRRRCRATSLDVAASTSRCKLPPPHVNRTPKNKSNYRRRWRVRDELQKRHI